MTNAKTYNATQTEVKDETDQNGQTYNANKVTAHGLKEGTTYYYTYQKDENTWSEPEKYTPANSQSYSFVYVGDPQIGSSNELKGSDSKEFYDVQSDAVMNDAFNWNNMLNKANQMTDGKIVFIMSAGDQIQTTKKKAPGKKASISEIEYTGFLSPGLLKNIPLASTVGNHDADNPNYTYHFNPANMSTLGTNNVTGGDYYFTCGLINTLVFLYAYHYPYLQLVNMYSLGIEIMQGLSSSLGVILAVPATSLVASFLLTHKYQLSISCNRKR